MVMETVPERTVLVDVCGTVEKVDGVVWETTAGDIVRSLCDDQESRCVLLEEWKGCARRLTRDERIVKVMDQWGFNESHEGRLVLVKDSKFYTHHVKTKRHGCTCVKVASRKRHWRKTKPKRVLVRDISQTIDKAMNKKDQVLGITMPTTIPEEIKLPIDISTLPSELYEEGMALQEELDEEEREHFDLERRKNELSENIKSQETETENLKQTIITLESMVNAEQHKLTKLVESLGPPELKEAQKEITKLENELKMRLKLNTLQSIKLRELNQTVSEVENEIQELM